MDAPVKALIRKLWTFLSLLLTCTAAFGQFETLTSSDQQQTFIGPFNGDTLRIPFQNEARLIAAPGFATSYQWSDGWRTPVAFISESGWVWVDIAQEEFLIRDSAYVLVEPPCIEFPSVVSPNSENGNDRLWIRANCEVRFLQMQIYDRWGNLMAQITEADKPWDLKSKDAWAQQGQYVALIEFETLDGIKKKYIRNITILR